MTISGWTIPLSTHRSLAARRVIGARCDTVGHHHRRQQSGAVKNVSDGRYHRDASRSARCKSSVRCRKPASRYPDPAPTSTKIVTTNLTATLDMKNIHSPGDYRLSVDVDRPGSVWKTTVSPSTVFVHVDKTAAEGFPARGQRLSAARARPNRSARSRPPSTRSPSTDQPGKSTMSSRWSPRFK